jgi:DNA-directed RNA polymerase specialized sigma24 family protein
MLMTERYLYIHEAAKLANLSTKTLYRRMNDGRLNYTIGADQRRQLRQSDVQALAIQCRASIPTTNDNTVNTRLRGIEQKLDELLALQQKLLSLYQPRSLDQLASKHKRS